MLFAPTNNQTTGLTQADDQSRRPVADGKAIDPCTMKRNKFFGERQLLMKNYFKENQGGAGEIIVL